MAAFMLTIYDGYQYIYSPDIVVRKGYTKYSGAFLWAFAKRVPF